MARRTTSLPLLQEYLWDQLPEERQAVGRTVVNDLINVLVQEWPDEQLSGLNPENYAGSQPLVDLTKSVRRHLRLVYGSADFDSMLLIAIQILLPILITQLLDWWKRRKENRARLRRWRRGWVNGQAE